MSPRAACRLEGLGFTDVYDYVEGIADWKAAGLPVEGEADHVQRVADATRPDVPTCRPEETIDDVRSRVLEAGWDICVVVDCDGVVIGRLHPAAHQDDDRATVGEVMSSGPGTVRADGILQPLVERLDHRDIPHVLVTRRSCRAQLTACDGAEDLELWLLAPSSRANRVIHASSRSLV